MKILFILPELPYPLTTGVRVKCHSILLAASGQHSCDIVSLGGEDITTAEQLISEYLPNASLLKILSPYKGWKLAYVKLITLIKRRPTFFARYSSRKIHSTISRVSSEGYDLIFIESFALVSYVSDVGGLPCVISITDALSITYTHAAEESNNFLFGLYRWHQLGSVKRAEAFFLPEYAGIHVVSDFDSEYLKREYKGVEVFSISHIVPEEVINSFINSAHLIKKIEGKKNILYSGRCSSDTLLNTLIDFVDKVYKPLSELRLDMQLTILSGESSKEVLKNLSNDGSIVIKEWVENYELELLNSDIIVFPDKSKCGVKTRLLYALASGKPIVATPEAIYGLPVHDGEHLIVRELGSKFVEAIQTLLDNEELSVFLGQNALELIQGPLSSDAHNHKWKGIFEKYVS